MPNLNKKISDTSVRLGEVRFSYANVFAPREAQPGAKEKYSVCILIPKKNKEAIALAQEAIDAAKQLGKNSKWGGRVPASLKTPLRDGDEERPEDENYAGCMFFNCSSTKKVGVCFKDESTGHIETALDDEDFYSGCYGAVTVNFYPYDTNGNRGVSAGLSNVIKLRDGERLAGGRSAETDFGDLGSSYDDDDFMN